MRYDFGVARRLYQTHQHPRVLLGPEDLVRLRRLVRRGVARKLMLALRRMADTLSAWVLDSDDLTAMFKLAQRRYDVPGSPVQRHLQEVALVGVLDDNPRLIEAVRRSLLVQTRDLGRVPDGPTLDLMMDRLAPAERRLLVRATVHGVRRILQQNRLNHYKGAGGNVLAGNCAYALNLLAVRGEPGVGQLDKELAQVVSFYEASANAAVCVDGYPEEDTGYGTGVGGFLIWVGEVLRRAGLLDPYRRCPRLAKFGRAVLHFVEPWGRNLADTGDHGDDFQERSFPLARLASLTKDPSLLWLLQTLTYTHGCVHPHNAQPVVEVEVPVGRDQHLPALAETLYVLDDLKNPGKPVHPRQAGLPTQFRDRQRGIVSFRSGWKADDLLVVFDGSQRNTISQGHAHASCGHFSLSALGEYFAIDTGRYCVEQDQHNLVLIDGRSGRSTNGEWRAVDHHGRLIDYQPDRLCDFAAVDSSHQHNCFWARRCLGLVKGNGLLGVPGYVWTVEDVNKNNQWSKYWWALNTQPENTLVTRKNSATVRGHRQGNLLDVHWVLPLPEHYPQAHRLSVTQDVQTPSSYKYVNLKMAKEFSRPADMVHGPVYFRPRLLGKVQGWNGRFLSVMIPRRRGQRPVGVTRLASRPMSLAVRLTFPRVVDTFIFAYEHHLLEAADIQGRGNWCLVRRDRSTGKLLDYVINDGSYLQVAGKSLSISSPPSH